MNFSCFSKGKEGSVLDAAKHINFTRQSSAIYPWKNKFSTKCNKAHKSVAKTKRKCNANNVRLTRLLLGSLQ